MIGQTVSHYRIVEKLGEGGMGVVYKAEDTELNRLVALKALPADTASDPERRARLLREAQTASGLNHPNIVTIHDILRRDEGDFIVMELVPGKTLDQMIPRGGMRLGEALKHAVQVASALEAAHDTGIVHRDLKPANIIVGDDGRVRVLDFGLAKLRGPVASAVEDDDGGSTRATEAAPRTREGQIVGTVSYMSPEQAEGREVDARSDIFSFGCVLYEMLTGRRPFGGASHASTLAAVLKEDPEPLPSDVPDELQRLVRRCLRKDRVRRLQHIVDARLALEDLKEESDSGTLSGGVPVAPERSRRVPGWVVATASGAVLVGLGAALWLWRGGGEKEPLPSSREIPFTSDPGPEVGGRFSPDGSTVVFSRGNPNGSGTLEAKVIGAGGARVLHESRPTPFNPEFSPDGRWIAFYTRTYLSDERARLLAIPRIGGEERLVAEVALPHHAAGISWTPDSEWLVTPDRTDDDAPFHLALVSAETGERRPLTNPPPGIMGDVAPALSPDGDAVVFARYGVWGTSDLYVLDLDEELQPAGEPRQLTHDVPEATAATWTPDGREVIFCSRAWHAATLWRVAVDGQTPPRPLGFGGRGAYLPDVDPSGSRLLYTRHPWDLNVWQVDLLPSGYRAGEARPLLRSNLVDAGAVFSPDGQAIAFVSERSDTREIWRSDREGGRLRQLTSLEDHAWGMYPAWSPDGQWLAFAAAVDGPRHDIYVVGSEGGVPRKLTSDRADDVWPTWSADGRSLFFESDRGGERRTWSVPLETGSPTLAENGRPGVADPAGRFRYLAEAIDDGWAIRRQSVDGGQRETVVPRVANGAFAVTSRGVYFEVKEPPDSTFPTHIAFLDLGTGQTTRIVELRPGTATGESLAVSPDERTLLYTQCDVEGEDDLVLVEDFR